MHTYKSVYTQKIYLISVYKQSIIGVHQEQMVVIPFDPYGTNYIKNIIQSQPNSKRFFNQYLREQVY